MTREFPTSTRARKAPLLGGARGGLCVFLALAPFAGAGAATPDYHADIAPILRDYCVGCHNGDDLEGGLSVETFHELAAGGDTEPPLAPGDASASYLIKTLMRQAKPAMPPKKEPQPKPDEIALIRAWIDAGAPGPAKPDDLSMLSTLAVPEIPPAAAHDAVTAMALSPNGRQLAVARFGEVELLRATDRTRVRLFPGTPGKINAVHFSPDGTRIVTASGITGLRGVATLWDVRTGKQLREFGVGDHRDILFDAEFSPDSKLLATAGYDRVIHLWELASGKLLRSIDVHTGAIFDLAFSPDGAILASASADDTVKLWNVATGERLDTLNQPQGYQNTVTFTPDGKFVLAAGADNRIRMWRLLSRDQPRINPVIHARFAHEDEIVRIEVSPDGKTLVSSSADRSIKTWSLPALRQIEAIEDRPDVAPALAFLDRGNTVLAGALDGSLDSFDVATGQPASPRKGRAWPPDAPAPPKPLAKLISYTAAEPNDRPGRALPIQLPAAITGVIDRAGDADLFRFPAKAGATYALDVKAARDKSPLDSRVEVLTADGESIVQNRLQAVRDSWFTFRGKDSEIVNDFRYQNWTEMELNEYLYCNGEVVKLWLYPRGADSGFNVYPGFGNRHTYFGTTALSHPLGEPCYIVNPLPPGTPPKPNGLPVFTLYCENDDDPQRRWGADSQLLFTAPADGDYLARISDVRGFGGDDFKYALAVRPAQPDFKVTVEEKDPAPSPGSGKEITFKLERIDGFAGPVTIDLAGLPAGFTATAPVIIEAGQYLARGVIFADKNANAPAKSAGDAVKLSARATIRGREVTHPLDSLGEIKLGAPAKLLVEIQPDPEGDPAAVTARPGQPLEFTIAPGETITALVKATRVNFKERIEFGKEDSNRNLPHGVFVDNIGLNGLLIVESQDQRQFFLTAAPWVPEGTRSFHLFTKAAGGHASAPALIHVRKENPLANANSR